MNEQIKQFFSLKRRTFVAGMAATSVAFGSSQVFGSSKIKVAGIYTTKEGDSNSMPSINEVENY